MSAPAAAIDSARHAPPARREWLVFAPPPRAPAHGAVRPARRGDRGRSTALGRAVVSPVRSDRAGHQRTAAEAAGLARRRRPHASARHRSPRPRPPGPHDLRRAPGAAGRLRCRGYRAGGPVRRSARAAAHPSRAGRHGGCSAPPRTGISAPLRRGAGPTHPVMLGLDDRDDLSVDQDGVGSAIDLGLLVAEPGNEPFRIVRGAGRRAECSGSSGSWSSMQISLTRRPVRASNIRMRIACSSPSPPSAAVCRAARRRP